MRLLPLVLLFGCREPVTQLVVHVGTDYRVPDELSLVEAHTERIPGGASSARHTYELGPGRLDVPFSFGVVAPQGEEDLEITVIVEGYALRGAPAPLVAARARTRFIPKKSLDLPLFLAKSCADVYSTCGAAETCEDGACTSAERPPEALAPHDPDRPPYSPPPSPRPDAGVPPDSGEPPVGCELELGAPALLGSIPIDFDPNLELLAADLDGDGVVELAAARREALSSPIAILDFEGCDSPVVTATAASGELRQGLLHGDGLHALTRRRITRWTYQGPESVQQDVLRASAVDFERLVLPSGGSPGFSVVNLDGSGWSYARFDAGGLGASTPAPQRPKGHPAHFMAGRHLHSDDLGLRVIEPGSPIVDLWLGPQVRDPVVVVGREEHVVAARTGQQSLVIAVWKSGNFTGTQTVDFGAEILAGPVAARNGEDVRFFVLLAGGRIAGCETHEDNGTCPLLSSSRPLALDEVGDDSGLLTAWIDQDGWADVVFVSRKGRVLFASGADLASDAAPPLDLQQDARSVSAIVPDFYRAFGIEGTLLVVQHSRKLSLVGWALGSGPASGLWPQHRRDASRTSKLP